MPTHKHLGQSFWQYEDLRNLDTCQNGENSHHMFQQHHSLFHEDSPTTVLSSLSEQQYRHQEKEFYPIWDKSEGDKI